MFRTHKNTSLRVSLPRPIILAHPIYRYNDNWLDPFDIQVLKNANLCIEDHRILPIEANADCAWDTCFRFAIEAVAEIATTARSDTKMRGQEPSLLHCSQELPDMSSSQMAQAREGTVHFLRAPLSPPVRFRGVDCSTRHLVDGRLKCFLLAIS